MALNLKKVTLEKSGDSTKISLSKQTPGELVINLNWGSGHGIDLDLGVFYQLRGPEGSAAGVGRWVEARWSDGRFYKARITKHNPATAGWFLGIGATPENYSVIYDDDNSTMDVEPNGIRGAKGVIDGIEFSKGRGGPRERRTAQGCYTEPPWIWHSGDDRSGAVSEGENVFINPAGIPQIQRVLVYAFIFEGVARWDQTDATVTVRVPTGEEVVVRLGEQSDRRGTCAIAMLEFEGDAVNITRLVTFHEGKSKVDEQYKFGFSWTTGGK